MSRHDSGELKESSFGAVRTTGPVKCVSTEWPFLPGLRSLLSYRISCANLVCYMAVFLPETSSSTRTKKY